MAAGEGTPRPASFIVGTIGERCTVLVGGKKYYSLNIINLSELCLYRMFRIKV